MEQVTIINTMKDFNNACVRGDLLSIVKSKNHPELLNAGFYSACRGGHKDLAELMITKGAKHWNDGLRAGCEEGHLEIVELMITKGASDYNSGLNNACFRGHKDLVKLMILQGANRCGCRKSITEH